MILTGYKVSDQSVQTLILLILIIMNDTTVLSYYYINIKAVQSDLKIWYVSNFNCTKHWVWFDKISIKKSICIYIFMSKISQVVFFLLSVERLHGATSKYTQPLERYYAVILYFYYFV